MKMTPALVILGGLLVFWSSVFIAIFLPAMTMQEKPSDIWQGWTAQQSAGHDLYVANGCSYCHSQQVRVADQGQNADRVSQIGDWYDQTPAILGTERTGPDLALEGGVHTDDWHIAHFVNPRNTRPMSLMPSWEFLGADNVRKLTALMQSQGGLLANKKMDGEKMDGSGGQNYWKAQSTAAFEAGPDKNIQWLHQNVAEPWRAMPNPYNADLAALGRGQLYYQQFCIGCHGPVGDGQTPAARYIYPPPLNFTTLDGRLWEDKYIGGIFYYQIMNGITGTAMPFFKRELESEKIWDVSNYVAVRFLGYTDAGLPPRGIPVSYEDPSWRNPYLVSPATQSASQPVKK